MLKRIFNSINRLRQPKAAILMYHQVCERKHDPWELAVHPYHFHGQLDYLKKNFRVVSIENLNTSIVNRTLKPKTIAITFDDGFQDNYTNAAPVLDWHELPAAFYVETTAMCEQTNYWWDQLQDILFQTEALPETFQMEVNGSLICFDLKSDRILNKSLINQIRIWNYSLPVPNERIGLYMVLWQRVKPLCHEQQNRILQEIKYWAGVTDRVSNEGVPMNIHEMQMLSQNPLFSIGAHSVHHSMLAEQNVTDQTYEVKESKRQIENWLDKPVKGFSYPYGNYNAVTQNLLKESGFDYAVSTESKLVTEEDDRYSLPRIQVKNWCMYEFATRINEMVN
jgi:peptidoglycan/xylan/chitin deacetylase (PgdA/CDA1 family)